MFSSQDYYEAQFARAALESAGIRLTVSGEALQTGSVGGVPFQDAVLRIFVRAMDEAEARAVLEDMRRAPLEQESWICIHCGVMVDGVFTRCWQCGHEEGTDQPGGFT